MGGVIISDLSLGGVNRLWLKIIHICPPYLTILELQTHKRQTETIILLLRVVHWRRVKTYPIKHENGEKRGAWEHRFGVDMLFK